MFIDLPENFYIKVQYEFIKVEDKHMYIFNLNFIFQSPN